MNLSVWIQALRLRTLFLSVACVTAGITCAVITHQVQIRLALLTLLTATCLQVLSNLANDYGDTIHGADHAGRSGPERMVQSGRISQSSMRTAIILFAVLSLVSGLSLLYKGIDVIGKNAALILFITGLAGIFAAIAYTNGKRPYGYMGLGDIAVFIFFGPVAVSGTAYLQTANFSLLSMLPALAFGCLATGVLNINNMRDIDSDMSAGKNSIPVRIGLRAAKIYHYILLLVAGIALSVFVHQARLSTLVLLPIILLVVINISAVMRAAGSAGFDPLLRILSVSTFIISVSFLVTALFI